MSLETQHPNLWLLPSGPVPPNPADLLSTGRIRKIIAEADEQFDLVIIDGPPTLGLADAPLLAAAAGNVLFVVESGKTRTRAAIEALNRLEATGTHVARRGADQGDGCRRATATAATATVTAMPMAGKVGQEADRDPNDPAGDRRALTPSFSLRQA